MGKPRILCISALPPPYHGTSVANDILLNSKLVRSKFEINILRLSKSKLQLGGNFSISTLLADLKVTAQIFKSLITFKPHVIYFSIAQTTMGLWREAIWIWLATLSGSKALGHMHGGNFRNVFDNQLDSLTRKFVQTTLPLLEGIIVLDPTLKYLFEGLIADDHVFVLRNGIPNYYNETQIAEANKQRAQSERLEVTYLSNLVPGKGFETFLAVANLLKEEGLEKNFLFKLAGAAPTPAIGWQVEKFVRSLNLENSVSIIGEVAGLEKDRLLMNSNVFVFTSELPEGQPLVIIEALAFGLPVIATAKGAIPSMVRDGVNGFIIPEADPAAMAERLKLLAANATLRLSMGAASRKIFQEYHTEEKFIQGFATILEKVIGVQ